MSEADEKAKFTALMIAFVYFSAQISKWGFFLLVQDI